MESKCIVSSCHICQRRFSEEVFPMIICTDGHCICKECDSVESTPNCPLCGKSRVSIPNQWLLQILETLDPCVSQMTINQEDIHLEDRIGFGLTADVYSAKWLTQLVAVKKLRCSTKGNKYVDELISETNLLIGLRHPNIIQVFGSTGTSEDGSFGIVMEYANGGALDTVMNDLDYYKSLETALMCVEGLSFIHSKRIAHLDLKPRNVLLFGRTARLSDFGLARVLQPVNKTPCILGTFQYAAPEMLETGQQFGLSADIYSLSMLCYELLTKKVPYKGMTAPQIAIQVVDNNLRPEFPADFFSSEELMDIIRKGWHKCPDKRPSLDEWRIVLKKEMEMFEESVGNADGDVGRVPIAVHKLNEVHEASVRNLKVESFVSSTTTMELQSMLVKKSVFPVATMNIRWENDDECARKLRANVVSKILADSVINMCVMQAMISVPYNLFVDEDEYNEWISGKNDEDIESPKSVGEQLSMLNIGAGYRVLVIGATNGYMTGLIAQIVGFRGVVVTICSSQESLDECRCVRTDHSPMRSVMKWIITKDLSSVAQVIEDISNEGTLDGNFDAIFICGYASKDYGNNLRKLLCEEGSMLLPVSELDNDPQLFVCQYSQEPKLYLMKQLSNWTIPFDNLDEL